MTTPTLHQQCADALERVRKSINRSAGQHQRAIKRAFAASAHTAGSEPATGRPGQQAEGIGNHHHQADK